MSTHTTLNDPCVDDANFAHLLPFYPDIPDFVWRTMLTYCPKASRVAWRAVREFTLATALASRPSTFDQTRRLLSMTARFHIWAWTTGVHSLTAETVYTQNRIDRYLDTELRTRSASHRWGTSRQLVSVGKALADRSLQTIRTPEFAGPSPFTTTDVASMHSWARSLSTEHSRQNASILLGLAGGAGLTSEEIIAARVGDIEVQDTKVFVHVRTGRRRRVPVRQAWAKVLMRGIDGRVAATEPLFIGYRFPEYPPRLIQQFLDKHPAKVRPTVSRLRTTWILHHLSAGVPVDALSEFAGFTSPVALVRYIAHMPSRPADTFIDMFIGGTAA